jgi:hypothetical protein
MTTKLAYMKGDSCDWRGCKAIHNGVATGWKHFTIEPDLIVVVLCPAHVARLRSRIEWPPWAEEDAA